MEDKDELVKKNNNKFLISIVILIILGIVLALVVPVVIKGFNKEEVNKSSDKVEELDEKEENNNNVNDDTTNDDNNTEETEEGEKNNNNNPGNETSTDVEYSDSVKSMSEFDTAEALLELVKLPTYGGIDEDVYKNGNITFDKMSDHYKFTLASKLIKGDLKYIEEKDMKIAFNNLYGKNKYKSVPNVVIGCIPYTYDNVNKRYVTEVMGCGGTSSFSVNELVLKSYTENGVYKIVTVVSYEDAGVFYKDLNLKNIISNTATFDIQTYMKNNSLNLEQYTYSFETENGNYIYKGSLRTNNFK